MDEDRLTLERFRRRMASIEPLVPDPPPAGPHAAVQRGPRKADGGRNDAAGRQVYLLLAVALAVLAAVASPYLARQQPPPATILAGPSQAPVAGPSTVPSLAAVASARPDSTLAALLPSADPGAACPLSPTLFDSGHSLPIEQWVGHDWALIEGNLQAVDQHRLAVQVTRGPLAGPVRTITWPGDYRVTTHGGSTVLRDAAGRVVAREGDIVVVSGSLQADTSLLACRVRPLSRGPAR